MIDMKSIRFPPPAADEMVRATLEGRKTVTRRVVKPQPKGHAALLTTNLLPETIEAGAGAVYAFEDGTVTSPPYRPGDILYVRETFFEHKGHFFYKADGKHEAIAQLGITFKWHPSIHMPREAARIFLRVTDVRVERLHTQFFNHSAAIFSLQEEGVDIENHCQGCISFYGCPCCIDEESECGELDYVRDKFANLWDSTIKLKDRAFYGWRANPWVWVIEFERWDLLE